jgi:hypothetical protein
MRWGWMRIGLLALLLGAGALPPASAWAQEPPPQGEGCNTRGKFSHLRCDIRRTDERGASGREARRCVGIL